MNAVWPGASLHYQQVIDRPRYEDYEIKYFSSNPWAHLGLGHTLETRKGHPVADCSYYLNLNNIDPKWHAAIGGDVEELRKALNEQNAIKEL